LCVSTSTTNLYPYLTKFLSWYTTYICWLLLARIRTCVKMVAFYCVTGTFTHCHVLLLTLSVNNITTLE